MSKPVLEVSKKCDSPNSIQAKNWMELPTDKPPALNLFRDSNRQLGWTDSNSIKKIKVTAVVSYLAPNSPTNESINLVRDAMIKGSNLFYRSAPMGKQVHAEFIYGEVRVEYFNFLENKVHIPLLGMQSPSCAKFK